MQTNASPAVPPGSTTESVQLLAAASTVMLEPYAGFGEIQQLGSEWSLFFRDIDGMELEVCAPAD